MRKLKFDFKKRMLCLTNLIFVNLLAFGVAVTAAAYVSIESHHQTITINTDYRSYFGGGTGTQADPFQIINGKHLKNLGYLTNVGVLTNAHYFRLVGDSNHIIDMTSEDPMKPIGTADSPFVSHLDGKIKGSNGQIPEPYISSSVACIKNLKITADNIADVGLFGYVDNSATIGYFTLQSPTITATGNAGIGFTDLDRNPVRAYFTEEKIRGITLTETKFVDTATQTKGMTEFKIDLSTLPTVYTYRGHSINIFPEFYLSKNGYLQNPVKDASSNIYTFKVPTASPETYNKDTNPGKYFTLAIKCHAFTEVLLNTGDPDSKSPRFSEFTIEKFRFYYNYENNSIINDPNDPRMYTKMNYPNVKSEKVNASKFILNDLSRGVYVGIVAGRLDGTATWIGVSDPKMNIYRPFISYSLLVGKAIDDDADRSLSKETADFSKVQYKKPKWINTPEFLSNYKTSSGGNIKNPDFNQKNRILDIYGQESGFTNPAKDTIRIYGTNKTVRSGPTSGAKTDSLKTDVVNTLLNDEGEYLKPDEKIGKDKNTHPVNSISISKDLSVEYYDLIKNSVTGGQWGYNEVRASNAIMMWISANDNSDWLDRLLNSGTDFFLNIDMDYMYFDDDPNITYDSTTNTVGGFSRKFIDICGGRRSVGKLATYGSWPYFEANYKFDNKAGFTRFDYTTSKDIQIMERVPTSDENNSAYEWAKIVYDGPLNQGESIRNKHLRMQPSNWNGPVAAATDPTKLVNKRVQHKKISIQPSKGSFSIFNNAENHKPIFYMGIFDFNRGTPDIPSGQNGYVAPSTIYPYRFDILNLTITISDIHGNMESSIGTVDFAETPGNNSPTILPITNDEFDPSKVKIGAKTILNKKENKAASTTPFLAPHADITGIANNLYQIVVSRNALDAITVTWGYQGMAAPAGKDVKYYYPQPGMGSVGKSTITYKGNITA